MHIFLYVIHIVKYLHQNIFPDHSAVNCSCPPSIDTGCCAFCLVFVKWIHKHLDPYDIHSIYSDISAGNMKHIVDNYSVPDVLYFESHDCQFYGHEILLWGPQRTGQTIMKNLLGYVVYSKHSRMSRNLLIYYIWSRYNSTSKDSYESMARFLASLSLIKQYSFS